MAHLRLIEPENADGLLAEEYAAAVERTGKVFNIVRSMSLNPEVLRASMELYKAIMFGPSGLSRQERELLATVVSAASATTDAAHTPTTSVTRAHQTSWHGTRSTTTAGPTSIRGHERSATTRGS